MSQTVADFLLGRLREWGVRQVFGYPGDGINGLLGAFHEVGDKVEFVQCRHEEIAAFAGALTAGCGLIFFYPLGAHGEVTYLAAPLFVWSAVRLGQGVTAGELAEVL